MTASDDDARAAATDLLRLHKAVLRVAGLLDATVLAQRAAREARRLVGTDLTSVAIRESPKLLVMRGVHGGRTQDFPGLHVPIGTGVGGKAMLVHKPIWVADYEHDPGITRDFVDVVVRGEGVGGMVGVPIVDEGEVLGILYGAIRSVGEVGDRAKSTLSEYADALAPHVAAALQSQKAIEVAILEERQRLAIQLHDSIGQLLFGIGISARRAHDRIPTGASDLVEELRNIEVQASRAASYLRDALRALSPPEAEEALPVSVAIDARAFSDRSGISSHFVVLGEPFDVSPAVSACMLAIVREGLHNVEKHSSASSVVMTLHYGEGVIEVIIQDDGSGLPAGFELTLLPVAGEHWGLTSLLQRVQSLAGGMVLIPNEDEGVTLRATIPIEHDAQPSPSG